MLNIFDPSRPIPDLFQPLSVWERLGFIVGGFQTVLSDSLVSTRKDLPLGLLEQVIRLNSEAFSQVFNRPEYVMTSRVLDLSGQRTKVAEDLRLASHKLSNAGVVIDPAERVKIFNARKDELFASLKCIEVADFGVKDSFRDLNLGVAKVFVHSNLADLDSPVIQIGGVSVDKLRGFREEEPHYYQFSFDSGFVTNPDIASDFLITARNFLSSTKISFDQLAKGDVVSQTYSYPLDCREIRKSILALITSQEDAFEKLKNAGNIQDAASVLCSLTLSVLLYESVSPILNTTRIGKGLINDLLGTLILDRKSAPIVDVAVGLLKNPCCLTNLVGPTLE